MSKTFTVEVLGAEDGSDDCLIPLPDELLEELGWNDGDELAFDVQSEYSIVMRKSNVDDPAEIRSSIIRLDKDTK